MGVYIGPTHTEEDVWVEIGELQMLVGPWDQKVSKTMIRPHQYIHNLFGNVPIKKNPLVTSDSNCIHLQFARCYWNFQWDWVLSKPVYRKPIHSLLTPIVTNFLLVVPPKFHWGQ